MKKILALLALVPGTAFAQQIAVDGSSTVYPISLAMAEEFQIVNPDAQITVGFAGTGGGFERFCAGETQISDASRVIEPDEVAACQEASIPFIELPIAADALTVVVNPENDWVECLTVEQLTQIWSADGGVTTWSDVNPEWPEEPLELYAPGVDSGTFDYFNEAIIGDDAEIRQDFSPSEDDNVLVQGVQGNTNAMGFFGYAYYAENPDTLKAVEIDGGDGCVAPSAETVEDASYTPLSRPLFIYVSQSAVDSTPALQDFVDFYLSPDNTELIEDTGYVTYDEGIYEAVQARFDERVTGSAFADFAPGDDVLEAVQEAEQ
ncbi:MAG: Phosphate ABC transporter, periplasmic phosphate-binding protein PstS [uncultured Truepera sp.]|uniref:Phosphate-binding protein n=1 Tax=uncultured Truepera sp. TaxID=543023 RepID=A0A6J4UXM6_9DEIN|nr:MAG: Phosphate ABC transporter, periplasmic phosphate-binding protein PstS [uncultured Truepera sp.]